MPATQPINEPAKSYLEVAIANVEDARDQLAHAQTALDDALRRAIHQDGYQVAEVARWAGLSRETVYQRTRRNRSGIPAT